MRRPLLIHIFLILGHFSLISSALAFNYQHERWHFEDLPVPCYLNRVAIPADLLIDNVEKAVLQSIATWNAIAPIPLFVYAGTIELGTPIADDRWNAISFIDSDWVSLSRAPASGAGVTHKQHVKASGTVKDGFFRGFDIVLNAEQYRWTHGAQPGRYDVQSVVTHELGHVLGLGHISGDEHAVDVPTMIDSGPTNRTNLRTLEADDIQGVRFIYRGFADGIISKDTRWANMILVRGDLIVPRDAKLTIEAAAPQTIVHFLTGGELIVEGQLNFEGVLFTGAVDLPWNGLVVRPAAEVERIVDCTFEDAKVGLTLMEQTDVAVQNGQFYRNETGMSVTGGHGLSIVGDFHHNRVGLEIQSSQNVEISKSRLRQNDFGLKLVDTIAQIQSSHIMDNRIGVEIQSEQPTVFRRNNITHNQIGVQILHGTADLGRSPDHLGFNNFVDNTRFSFVLNTPSPKPLLAQGNYWGELTAEQIDSAIRDDDEMENLPAVRFEPLLDQFSQAELEVEFSVVPVSQYTRNPTARFSPEALMDSPGTAIKWDRFESIDGRVTVDVTVQSKQEGTRKVFFVGAQGIGESAVAACTTPGIDVRLRVVNVGTRKVESFEVAFYFSLNTQPTPNTDFRLADRVGRYGRTPPPVDGLNPGEDWTLDAPLDMPDLPISGASGQFYIYPHVIIHDTGESFNPPGQQITVYEGLADLVGTIEQIPAAASAGEDIDVRYGIKNYGQQFDSGQTVRFYLSATRPTPTAPATPDYPLSPAIRLQTLEGKWTARLTVPADVPKGDYFLWVLVDAENDVLECSRHNNPAAYLDQALQIGESDPDDPRRVQADGKHPIALGTVKTQVLQNFPNPFNPETWIPYQLAEEADVTIRIFDDSGQLVRTLSLDRKAPRAYLTPVTAAYWDGTNDFGERLASGVYLYEFSAGNYLKRRRMTLIK